MDRLRLGVLLVWRLRLVAVAFVLAWFFSETLRLWIPVWIPFLVAAAVEAQFFLSGVRQARPQPLVGVEAAAEAGLRPKDLPDERDRDLGFDEERLLDFSAPRASLQSSWSRRHPLLKRLLEAGAVLAVVAAILVLAPRGGWQSLSTGQQASFERSLSAAATSLAGHRALVTCDTSYHYVGLVQDADGLAYVGGHSAYLTPEICYTLYRVSRGHADSFDRASWALAVLGHESAHLSGIRSESLAQCAGIRSGVALGIRFGLDRGEARRLMHYRLVEDPIDHASSPAYLVGADCRLP